MYHENSILRQVSAIVPFVMQQTGIYAGMYIPEQDTYHLFNAEGDTTFFMSEMSVAGSITEEQFIESFDISNLINVKLKTLVTKEVVTPSAYIINQYYKDKKIPRYVRMTKNNDGLSLNISGVLKQTADTIGKDRIILVFTFEIFQISDDESQRNILTGRL